jgi:methyl-accepting chemotaxis protein
MQNALPYVQRTNDLGKCVHDISRHLTQQNSALIDLTQRLEALFDLFSRGNELLKIMQQYSASLQHDITNVRKMHASYKQSVETIALHMESVQDHLQSITDLLVALHENAGSFISSAQTLGHLAKNTEIRAYHAKREGKGLGIIATECLSLAKQAQLPFHDFSSVLKDLEEVALPVIQELDTVIDLSEWSRHLFDTSLKTLETIDNATTTLQAIVKRVEENSALSTTLQANIDTGLSTLKGQMVLSLTAIDDLSIRCSRIQSQAHIVNTLHNMLSAGTKELTRDQEHLLAIQHHYDHYLQESIRSSSRFMNVKKLPVFSSEVFQSILSMEKQIKTLNASVQDITQYRDYVGTGMNEVHSLAQQILDFLGKAQTMYEHLHGLGANLHAEVQKIETLMGSTTKIFNKLKTLTTFARIEEGRSMQYQDIIGPIVQNFVDLEIKTEQAFALFAPKLAQLKKNIQFLRTQHEMIKAEQLKYPDYSKIKLFLDDIVRVFIEEHKQIAHIARSAEDLYKNNTILEHDWQRFQTITSAIQEITGAFTAQAPRYDQ